MQNEGYLLIDHRASPGLTPEDFRKVGITAAGLKRLGLDMAEFGEGKILERGTARCCHCGKNVFLNPERERARSFCRTCPKGLDYLCDDPKCHFDCKPYRKMLDDLRNDLEKAAQMEQGLSTKTMVLDLPDLPDGPNVRPNLLPTR